MAEEWKSVHFFTAVVVWFLNSNRELTFSSALVFVKGGFGGGEGPAVNVEVHLDRPRCFDRPWGTCSSRTADHIYVSAKKMLDGQDFEKVWVQGSGEIGGSPS